MAGAARLDTELYWRGYFQIRCADKVVLLGLGGIWEQDYHASGLSVISCLSKQTNVLPTSGIPYCCCLTILSGLHTNILMNYRSIYHSKVTKRKVAWILVK